MKALKIQLKNNIERYVKNRNKKSNAKEELEAVLSKCIKNEK